VQASKPASPAGSGILIERGTLWRAVCERTQSALACGALHPIETLGEIVEDAGVPFFVHVIADLESVRKTGVLQAVDGATPNPFLPYDERLCVADVSDTHVCLLNKYYAIANHVLIVTRSFEEQTDLLTPRDWEALWACMGEFDSLGFYNSGEIAGASQRHRHLQLVPVPIGAGPRRTPIDALLDDARFDGPVGSVDGLPFLHAAARLRSCAAATPADAADVLHALYREMLRAFGCDDGEHPYNVLLTRDWMLFVPRTRHRWHSVPINALGFAGSLLARDRDELERVRRAGPMHLLRHVAVARG
jgi:ATP adenylyltransferase